MYQTRHQSAFHQQIDENSKHGAHHNINANAKISAASTKGSMIPNNNHHKNNNKTTSINARKALGDIGNIVPVGATRHSQADCANAKKAVLPSVAVGRPITRSYGALLAANQRSQQQDAACTVQSTINGVAQELPQRKNSNRAANGRSKGRTLTATLTARSEAVVNSKLPNIDAEDEGNQLAAVDYVEDMYSFYRKTEPQSCVPADYMSRQTDINHKMRAILVNWLIEVHFKFKLMQETLFLTTNVLDRFLSTHLVVDRENLQLVGITSLIIASKYEEIWAPQINDLIYISDNAYTREQILDMEKTMLNILRFNLCVPTPYMFIVRFLKAAKSDGKLQNLAFYYVELSLLSYEMLKYSPSMIAAAAVYAAQNTLTVADANNGSSSNWTPLLKHHSGYAETQILECARKMVNLHEKSQQEAKLNAVSRKYALEKYESVALLTPPTI